MNTEESRQPKKQKKIIRWLLGLAVPGGRSAGPGCSDPSGERKKGCLMLNLKNGRESTVNVDLVCCGFGLPSTGTGYFCVVPAYRSLYQSTDLKSMNGIFFSTGLVSLALYILLLAVVALLLRRRICTQWPTEQAETARSCSKMEDFAQLLFCIRLA